MHDDTPPRAPRSRLAMLALSGVMIGQILQMPAPIAAHEMGRQRPGGYARSVTKAERAKRNVRKAIAKQSKKRNRRR